MCLSIFFGPSGLRIKAVFIHQVEMIVDGVIAVEKILFPQIIFDFSFERMMF